MSNAYKEKNCLVSIEESDMVCSKDVKRIVYKKTLTVNQEAMKAFDSELRANVTFYQPHRNLLKTFIPDSLHSGSDNVVTKASIHLFTDILVILKENKESLLQSFHVVTCCLNVNLGWRNSFKILAIN